MKSLDHHPLGPIRPDRTFRLKGTWRPHNSGFSAGLYVWGTSYEQQWERQSHRFITLRSFLA